MRESEREGERDRDRERDREVALVNDNIELSCKL